MKKLILMAGLCSISAIASAQSAPTQAQATQALQNAMQREIQAMGSSGQNGTDTQTATNVARTLQVKSVENCQAVGSQAVACDVRTRADVKGTPHEEFNKYQFWQEGGHWEAKLQQGS
jgi:hypothetical protein